MLVNGLALLLSLAIMFMGELIPNETKKVYIEKGLSWKKVILYSNLSGLFAGLISIVSISITKMPDTMFPPLLVIAVTITSYITTQSVMTDMKTHLINRNILRVAYLTMYLIGIFNIVANEELRANWLPLLFFTVVLIIIFIFIPIGPSDVRAIAVGVPYVLSIGGFIAIQLLIVSLLFVAIAMTYKRMKLLKPKVEEMKLSQVEIYEEMGEKDFNKAAKKVAWKTFNESEEYAMPVGPFMIIPFLIYLTIYPFFI